MLNVLLLLAGKSAFFSEETFVFPKTLVEIDGKPMIQHVIENLDTIKIPKRMICIVNADDCRKYHLDNVLKLLCKDPVEIVKVDGETGGAVCSALLAIQHINNEEPLIIANPDQVIQENLNHVVDYFKENEADAGVICFEAVHPRWSFIRFDEQHKIVEAAEKRPISKHAIAGFYYFKKGADFVKASKLMMQKGIHVNGSYYVSMVFNELVLKGMHLLSYHVESDLYHTFYSPQKIEEYEKKQVQQKAIEGGGSSREIIVVIPMAGLGSRFETAGFNKPKPFIDVAGKPMIARIMDNLALENARYVLIAQKKHLQKNPEIVQSLKDNYPVVFVEIEGVTEGTACTVLQARQFINRNSPLLIANCDQIVDVEIGKFVEECMLRGLDGSILTFEDPNRDPKWSFAKVDHKGLVVEVKEKKPISEHATVGIYLFSKGCDFIESATDMIVHNDRVNNEFYTCPVYNYAIKAGKQIGIYPIPPEAMHGLGTPADLKDYLELLSACTV